MTNKLTIDSLAKAFAEELTSTCGTRLGNDASSAPSEAPVSEGWTVTIPVSGPVIGAIVVWCDAASAGAYARVILQKDLPSDEECGEVLALMSRDAATAVQARPECAGVLFGAPAVGHGSPAPGSRSFYVAVPNVASCALAVGVNRATVPAKSADERLGAVLAVDLPLVVRFGRTLMPMREVALLGPGAVIDMGRSPDEPVDVLVGDRLIARGEVVVVGGNYGVRITTLASSADAGAN